MIAQLNGGSFLGTTVEEGRICGPRLPSVPQMALKTTPLVPLEETIASNEQQGKRDEYQNPDACDFDQVSPEIIDNRRVHVATKGDRILFGHGENGRVER